MNDKNIITTSISNLQFNLSKILTASTSKNQTIIVTNRGQSTHIIYPLKFLPDKLRADLLSGNVCLCESLTPGSKILAELEDAEC